MISKDQAERFAREWIEAWNSHDLDRILAHYAENFVMSSPRIAVVAGEPSGILSGKAALGAYWKKVLALGPTLHFELQRVFVGADCVVLHYEGVRGPAAEVFFFGTDGQVVRSAASYWEGSR